MKLMHQPFNGQLGNKLIELLESQDYHTLNIVVAFAKNSGVLRLKDSFEKFIKRGGVVNIYVGIDLGVTSYDALTSLLLCTSSLNVVHAEKTQTFHTKVYQFLGEKKGVIIVGSHNLTGGGLWTNFESSMHISLDISNTDDIELLKVQENYFQSLTSLKDSFMPIKIQEDIDKLLQNGYITKEINQKTHTDKKTIKGGAQKSLFGNGAPATLPPVFIPKKKTTAPVKRTLDEEVSTIPTGTIWFESRAMTGGSRNILDLSKTSLIERGETKDIFYKKGKLFISGAVSFFGLDPENTIQQKDIVIIFEGVEYRGNTILYPTGKKQNGTWRLQIKGEDLSDIGISEAFRRLNEEDGKRYDAKDNLLLYLQAKIITFTKVKDDYYIMSVLPESKLSYFRDNSKVLARNGNTIQARQLGII